jgi:phage terminase small subunit
MKDPLTHKQRMFINEYLVDMNATQAALRAGYNPRRAHVIGSELVNNSRVAPELKKAIELREKRCAINQDYVISTIHKIIERCIQTVASGGDPARFNPAAALKGCELLGKHLGVFAEDNKQRSEIMVVRKNLTGAPLEGE